ncbi:prolipoprotein diacylglyceryl transferase [Schleiferiaceae bacterium]|jgi:prolipoprotein diacylglyceryltransferase|nr:prolipoprotein diacylglyceryl transferase [Schleiferiaceae bacterium]
MIATILWDFPNHIPIAGFELRFYSLMFIISFVLGQYGMQYVFKKENVNPKLMDSLVYWMVGATIIGARLGHVFFYDWGYYKNHLGEILMVWKGGLASHGAAISIVLAMIWWSQRIAKKHPIWTLDRIVIVVALAGGFIRMGNWFNSEIYGAPANSSVETVFVEAGRASIERGYGENIRSLTFDETGTVFTTDSLNYPVLEAQFRFIGLNENQTGEYVNNYLARILNATSKDNANILSYPDATAKVYKDENGAFASINVLGVPRYPTQLFEAAAYWLIFLILAFLYLKTNAKNRRGFIFGAFLIGVFGFRFFVEYYKEIQVSFETSMSLNMGQWLSIPLVISGFYLMLTSKEHNS